MVRALALVALIAGPASAFEFNSPTFNQLSGEARRSSSFYGSKENAKNAGAAGFTGETVKGGGAPVLAMAGDQDDQPPAPQAEGDKPPVYVFPKPTQPVKGVTIYANPELDPTGNAGNGKPEKTSPIPKWAKYASYGAIGLGLLGIIAGFFCPPLWIAGGILLGAGATAAVGIRLLEKKINGSN